MKNNTVERRNKNLTVFRKTMKNKFFFNKISSLYILTFPPAKKKQIKNDVKEEDIKFD